MNSLGVIRITFFQTAGLRSFRCSTNYKVALTVTYEWIQVTNLDARSLCIWMSHKISWRESRTWNVGRDLWLCLWYFFLPGQMEVQSPFWTLEPAQVRPPLSGVGFVHNRVRFWVPRPQEFGWPDDVHSDHDDHDDQPPLTVLQKKIKGKIKYISHTQLLVGSNQQS